MSNMLFWIFYSHKENFSWSVPLYSQWQASINEQRPIPDDYLPSWKESLPFARRKITVHNLHPSVSGLTFDRLQRFQGSINGGIIQRVICLCVINDEMLLLIQVCRCSFAEDPLCRLHGVQCLFSRLMQTNERGGISIWLFVCWKMSIDFVALPNRHFHRITPSSCGTVALYATGKRPGLLLNWTCASANLMAASGLWNGVRVDATMTSGWAFWLPLVRMVQSDWHLFHNPPHSKSHLKGRQ